MKPTGSMKLAKLVLISSMMLVAGCDIGGQGRRKPPPSDDTKPDITTPVIVPVDSYWRGLATLNDRRQILRRMDLAALVTQLKLKGCLTAENVSAFDAAFPNCKTDNAPMTPGDSDKLRGLIKAK